MPQKYHHLIPKTYLTPWVYNNDSLNVHYRGESGFKERNRKKILGVTHYHSIIAGMPICTQADTDIIFAPLKDKCVKINGVVITDTLEMNNRFGSFEDWEITNSDGLLANKNDLKNKIEINRILEIENKWQSEYENKWDKVRNIIVQNVLDTHLNSVPSLYKEYLCRMFAAMDWRGIQSNEHFRKGVLQVEKISAGILDFEIPYSDRDLKFIKTPVEYFTHCVLLKHYREFFDNKGIISFMAKAYQKGTIKFYFADNTLGFYTSDNPAFIDHVFDNDKKIGILPISPRILMAILPIQDTGSGKFLVEQIDKTTVKRFNKAIQRNCVELVISEKKS